MAHKEHVWRLRPDTAGLDRGFRDFMGSATGRWVETYIQGQNKKTCAERLYNLTELTRSEAESVAGSPSMFGTSIYREATRDETERLGREIQAAIDNGWLVWCQQEEEWSMGTETNDLTTLMWQVALTNWDTTKKELTSAQVATMARISLQALGNAAFPGSVSKYDADQVNKALAKATTVLTELNERMSLERGRLLSEKSE